MAKRKKIDWENIPITVIEEGSPNPQNPYAQLSPEERMNCLKELCQTIYMRRLEKSTMSSIQGSGGSDQIKGVICNNNID